MKTSLEAQDVWTQTKGSEIHENVNEIVAEMKFMNSKTNYIEHLLIKVLKVPSYNYIPTNDLLTVAIILRYLSLVMCI